MVFSHLDVGHYSIIVPQTFIRHTCENDKDNHIICEIFTHDLKILTTTCHITMKIHIHIASQELVV